MPYDALLMFSNAQAVTATAPSTDTLDLGLPSVNPRSATGARFVVSHGAGNAGDFALVCKVGADFVGLTSIDVQLQSSTDNSTWTTVATTGAIPLAKLKAGYEFGFNGLPLEAKGRYLRLNYVVVGTGTAGNITAGIADGFQTAGRV